MKKVQRSRYARNDKIAVIPNDQKLKMHLKSLIDWPSKSQHIINILKNHRKPMNGVKNSNLKTCAKSLMVRLSEFLTIDKHLKAQTTKSTTEITKTHRKPENGIKKHRSLSTAKTAK